MFMFIFFLYRFVTLCVHLQMNLQGVRKDIKTATEKLEKICMAAAGSSASDVEWRMNYIHSETKHIINHLIDTNVRLGTVEQAYAKQVTALRTLRRQWRSSRKYAWRWLGDLHLMLNGV